MSMSKTSIGDTVCRRVQIRGVALLLTDHVMIFTLSCDQYTCVYCLRQWSDCQVIGRDLIRLLQSVARIPEFEELWKDLLQNPSSLSPHFTGITTCFVTTLNENYAVVQKDVYGSCGVVDSTCSVQLN